MDKMNRRRFLLSGATGLATWALAGKGWANMPTDQTAGVLLKQVALGKTGLHVSPLALGTGTVGYNKSSNQTRLGMDTFVRLVHQAYDQGVQFFDMADGYGSHPFVSEALKSLPREKVTLLSKIWTHDPGSDQIEPVAKLLDRFRQEVRTDYLDVVLMHCLMKGDWMETRKHYMDGLARAKQDGLVKAVGVSCHNWEALVAAADSPWVDVIMARINPFGSKMDGTPEAVKGVLAQAIRNGKGVIGMKIFGQGDHVSEPEREQSINYALKEVGVHSITIGFESLDQLDDGIRKVARAVSHA